MKQDCYAVLGVSPAAEDVVIRAAYLALLRNYHPDRNASAEAAARTRAITEAYKTIGDPARRAEYDSRRAAHEFDIPGYMEDARPWAARWGNAAFMAGVAASAVVVVAAVMLLPQTESGRPNAARPKARTAAVSPPRALATETAIPAAGPKSIPATPIPVRAEAVEPPPPPVLPAPIKKPLRAGPQLAQVVEKPTPKLENERPSAPTAKATQRAAVRQAASPKPVPAADGAKLAALERHSTLLYSQSVINSDGARRARLQQARDQFVAARGGCRSESCVTDAYLAHIREVARIMAAPEPANP